MCPANCYVHACLHVGPNVILNVFSRLRNTDCDMSVVEVQLVNCSTRPDYHHHNYCYCSCYS